ncbi:hypothetical protein CEUSTIGMA_g10103.t1 [Chlamydomonas eustigma]|uniref:Uncharacterized protein n=1 Tax=Chlamydomonas eustigma TaxID=1157962 RepID=A0A250XHW5_9CHLO|nr:hypothetical protein CEUSTIGMA_g10103.t1 [Chlamydomonas eustigma]|eukprot:GAX82677.1 hypothetical protein CEUSTIGMA_g10103.t1 [Chlamydomonas eustigma]
MSAMLYELMGSALASAYYAAGAFSGLLFGLKRVFREALSSALNSFSQGRPTHLPSSTTCSASADCCHHIQQASSPAQPITLWEESSKPDVRSHKILEDELKDSMAVEACSDVEQSHTEGGHDLSLQALNPLPPTAHHVKPDLRSDQDASVQQQQEQPPSPAYTIPYKPDGEASPNTVLISGQPPQPPHLSEPYPSTFEEPRKGDPAAQQLREAVQGAGLQQPALKLDKEVMEFDSALTWGSHELTMKQPHSKGKQQAGVGGRAKGQSGTASPVGSPQTAESSPDTAADSATASPPHAKGGKKKTRQ